MTNEELELAKRDYPGKWRQARQSAAERGYRLDGDAYWERVRELFVAYGGRPPEKCKKRSRPSVIPEGFQVNSIIVDC